jgi:phytanoyl-CoA hydroxylase
LDIEESSGQKTMAITAEEIMVCRKIALSEEQIRQFNQDGFLIIEHFLDEQKVAQLRARFEPLFAGEFDTGIYPDEWYWREGLSLPDVTRHMGNAWKSDQTIARLAL